MEKERIEEDDEIFNQLSRTLGRGVRFENGDFEVPDSELVIKMVPIAKCRDCDVLLHSRDDIEKTGRYRENVSEDGKTHAEKFDHTVDVITEEKEGYILRTHNPR